MNPKDIKSICFWLIEQCRKTGSEEMKVTQENVTRHGEKLGDWEIIVRKIK